MTDEPAEITNQWSDGRTWEQREEEFPHQILFAYAIMLDTMKEMWTNKSKPTRRDKLSILRTIALMTPNANEARREIARRSATDSA